MGTNLEIIQEMLDYIDHHLDEKLDLDDLAARTGYSKYHLSRLFAHLTEMSIHRYIQRRRLTEGAKLLVGTTQSILTIALSVGYETQAAFTKSFRKCFGCSPRAYRKKGSYYPQQLKLHLDEQTQWPGEKAPEIHTAEKGNINLVGYHGSTRWGFGVIGKCWRRLHQQKHRIQGRTDADFLIGLNDYSAWDLEGGKQPAFDYYSAAEVTHLNGQPSDMATTILPPSRYVVFTFRANSQDSLQPMADYVYKAWFPHTAYQLNEHSRYDFARYGEAADAQGQSQIEFWVPIQ